MSWKWLPIGDGKLAAKVDNDAFALLSRQQWIVVPSRSGRAYAATRAAKTSLMMHRLVFGTPSAGLLIDHINNDSLDNRLENLRALTPGLNVVRGRTGKYGCLGVGRKRGKWRASICVNAKKYELGLFDSLEEATAVRIRAEVEHYGRPCAEI